MKLHVLSDLHLGFAPFERPRTEADVVVLAGDIARPREAVTWAMEFDRPVLYVAGNHEFYGGSIEGTLAELRIGLVIDRQFTRERQVLRSICPVGAIQVRRQALLLPEKSRPMSR